MTEVRGLARDESQRLLVSDTSKMGAVAGSRNGSFRIVGSKGRDDKKVSPLFFQKISDLVPLPG